MGYPGGKNGAGIYQRIINLMPPHEAYIEPFLGGGAVMRLKRPALLNVGVDMAWSVISNPPFGAGPRSDFEFIQTDGIDYLARLRNTVGLETLVYCDPPYLMSTRTDRRLYEFEMTTDQHRLLLRVIKSLRCLVMISGYQSKLYHDQLHKWNMVSYQAMTRGGTQRTELLWFNFPKPTELHDYSYLGEGYRERERIKRKKQRWTERLKKMPELERQALLAAIADTAGTGVKDRTVTTGERIHG